MRAEHERVKPRVARIVDIDLVSMDLPPAKSPTFTIPGSEARIIVMMERAAEGTGVLHGSDLRLDCW